MKLFLVILFSLTALGGAYLASFVFSNTNTPRKIAIIHGSFAILGIVLLIIYSVFYSAPLLSLFLFILAALGGLLIFFRDLVGTSLPKPLVLGHGLIALSGLFFLVLWMLK